MKPAKKIFSVFLCWIVLWGQSVSLGANQTNANSATPPVQADQIKSLLKKSYLELLNLTANLNYPSEQIKKTREELKREKKAREEGQKHKQKEVEKQINSAQKELKKINESASKDDEKMQNQRQALHCQIQSLEKSLAEIKITLRFGIPVEYDNYNAKLELLEKWPAEKITIKEELVAGKARTRRWGDVEDIGVRTIEPNQEDDIRRGQEAVNEMKQMGMLPKEIEDAKIAEYINRVAQNIARNSDLKVPLRVTILNAREINAFALPGGFLFVNRGLIEATESESQLAGVLAHEISHDVARHGHRLMKKATIAGIIYQAAQIGAMIFTGGTIGIGMYYLLTYSFQGLGLLLSLELLGVSRDYEIEADILGTQYVWNAGYNPEGFIEFFDIMASKEGYVEKTSFFRTHPAFYERIVTVYREISFLPQKDTIEDTAEFQEIKDHLKNIAKNLEQEEKDRPTLYKEKENCPTGQKEQH